MNRDDVAERLLWLTLGLLGVAGALYFYPVVTWKLPFVAALAAGFTFAYLVSTPGKPKERNPRLRALNVTSGSVRVQGGFLVVGDQWGPTRNKERLVLRNARIVEYRVSLRSGVVSGVKLRAVDGTFEPAEADIAVDSGFVSFFDASWQERGLQEHQIASDVQAVLSSAEPLHLLVFDSTGDAAGLVVGSGHGDGIYRLRASEGEAKITFH